MKRYLGRVEFVITVRCAVIRNRQAVAPAGLQPVLFNVQQQKRPAACAPPPAGTGNDRTSGSTVAILSCLIIIIITIIVCAMIFIFFVMQFNQPQSQRIKNSIQGGKISFACEQSFPQIESINISRS